MTTIGKQHINDGLIDELIFDYLSSRNYRETSRKLLQESARLTQLSSVGQETNTMGYSLVDIVASFVRVSSTLNGAFTPSGSDVGHTASPLALCQVASQLKGVLCDLRFAIGLDSRSAAQQPLYNRRTYRGKGQPVPVNMDRIRNGQSSTILTSAQEQSSSNPTISTTEQPDSTNDRDRMQNGAANDRNRMQFTLPLIAKPTTDALTAGSSKRKAPAPRQNPCVYTEDFLLRAPTIQQQQALTSGVCAPTAASEAALMRDLLDADVPRLMANAIQRARREEDDESPGVSPATFDPDSFQTMQDGLFDVDCPPSPLFIADLDNLRATVESDPVITDALRHAQNTAVQTLMTPPRPTSIRSAALGTPPTLPKIGLQQRIESAENTIDELLEMEMDTVSEHPDDVAMENPDQPSPLAQTNVIATPPPLSHDVTSGAPVTSDDDDEDALSACVSVTDQDLSVLQKTTRIHFVSPTVSTKKRNRADTCHTSVVTSGGATQRGGGDTDYFQLCQVMPRSVMLAGKALNRESDPLVSSGVIDAEFATAPVVTPSRFESELPPAAPEPHGNAVSGNENEIVPLSNSELTAKPDTQENPTTDDVPTMSHSSNSKKPSTESERAGDIGQINPKVRQEKSSKKFRQCDVLLGATKARKANSDEASKFASHRKVDPKFVVRAVTASSKLKSSLDQLSSRYEEKHNRPTKRNEGTDRHDRGRLLPDRHHRQRSRSRSRRRSPHHRRRSPSSERKTADMGRRRSARSKGRTASKRHRSPSTSPSPPPARRHRDKAETKQQKSKEGPSGVVEKRKEPTTMAKGKDSAVSVNTKDQKANSGKQKVNEICQSIHGHQQSTSRVNMPNIDCETAQQLFAKLTEYNRKPAEVEPESPPPLAPPSRIIYIGTPTASQASEQPSVEREDGELTGDSPARCLAQCPSTNSNALDSGGTNATTGADAAKRKPHFTKDDFPAKETVNDKPVVTKEKKTDTAAVITKENVAEEGGLQEENDSDGESNCSFWGGVFPNEASRGNSNLGRRTPIDDKSRNTPVEASTVISANKPQEEGRGTPDCAIRDHPTLNESPEGVLIHCVAAETDITLQEDSRAGDEDEDFPGLLERHHPMNNSAVKFTIKRSAGKMVDAKKDLTHLFVSPRKPKAISEQVIKKVLRKLHPKE